jgi:Flp pilus assembly protein TadG
VAPHGRIGRHFLTASDTNTTGKRDLTIPEIVRRFDSQHNAASPMNTGGTSPRTRCGLTYAFANADEVATLPMTHTRQLLQTYFTARMAAPK